MNIEVVLGVGSEVQLLEDGRDVIFEESVELPVHFQRPSQYGKRAGKDAVILLVAQFKRDVSASPEALFTSGNSINGVSFDVKPVAMFANKGVCWVSGKIFYLRRCMRRIFFLKDVLDSEK